MLRSKIKQAVATIRLPRRRRSALGPMLIVTAVVATAGISAGAAVAATPTAEVIVTRISDGTSKFTGDPLDDGLGKHTPGDDKSDNNHVVRTQDSFVVRVDWDINDGDAKNAMLKVSIKPLKITENYTPLADWASWNPDKTGMFNGCDREKSYIDGVDLYCSLGDATRGQHGAVYPIGKLGWLPDNSTFTVTAELTADGAKAATSSMSDVDKPLNDSRVFYASEAPRIDVIKQNPIRSWYLPATSPPNENSYYVALFPITLIDYGEALPETKGTGPLNPEPVPIDFYDHLWDFPAGSRLATGTEMRAAGLNGPPCGSLNNTNVPAARLEGASFAQYPNTRETWTCKQATVPDGHYPVESIVISNYQTDRAKYPKTNGDGTPNKGVFVSGQIAVYMPWKPVQDEINKNGASAVFNNSIAENSPNAVVTSTTDLAKIRVPAYGGKEITTEDNTGSLPIGPAGGFPIGDGGGIFTNHYTGFQYEPLTLNRQIDDKGNELNQVRTGLNLISSNVAGYVGGRVSRSTPVQMQLFVTASVLEPAAGKGDKPDTPLQGCLNFENSHLFVVPHPDITVELTKNKDLVDIITEPSSGRLADLRYGQVLLSALVDDYGTGVPQFLDWPKEVTDRVNFTVEYAHNPDIVAKDSNVNKDQPLKPLNSVTCYNSDADSRGWVQDTGRKNSAGKSIDDFYDAESDSYRDINMVRVRTTGSFPWYAVNPLYPGGKVTPNYIGATSGFYLSVSAKVDYDLKRTPDGTTMYVQSARAIGPLPTEPAERTCQVLFGTDVEDNQMKNNKGVPGTTSTGWCSQDYNVGSEGKKDPWTDLDTSGFTKFNTTKILGTTKSAPNFVDSDHDKLTVITIRPTIKKVNTEGPVEITANKDRVTFRLDYGAVGSPDEALTNVIATDALPAYYQFVEMTQPTTPGASCEPIDDGDGTQTISCRFSQADPKNPDGSALPRQLGPEWTDSILVTVEVKGASGTSKGLTDLKNVGRIKSSGVVGKRGGTFDYVNLYFDQDQSATDSAKTYLPIVAEFGSIWKTITGGDGPCTENLLPDQYTTEQWQARCKLIALDEDSSNLTTPDDDGNINYTLNYLNDAEMRAFNLRFVDVLPFDGDGGAEPGSSSGSYGADPSTAAAPREPASIKPGDVGFVGLAIDETATDTNVGGAYPKLTNLYVTAADPTTVSRDPQVAWAKVPWCDAIGGGVVNGVAGPCPASAFDVTATYAVIDRLDPQRKVTMNLTVDTEKAACDSVWTNTFGGRVDLSSNGDDKLFLPVRSNDVTAMTLCGYDLALQKRVGADYVTQQDDTWATAGKTVIPWDIEVINQGQGTVEGFDVTDYVDTAVFTFDPAKNPAGTSVAGTLGSSGTGPALAYTWSAADPEKPVATFAGQLKPGESTIVTVNLTLKKLPDGDLINYSEISRFDNDGNSSNGDSSTPNGAGYKLVDIDSTPDNINNEPADGKLVDNVIDNSGGDEDDHDIASVPWYDLALVKDLANGQSPILDTTANPVTVKYVILVKNQGYLPVTKVQITDTPAAGFGYASSNPTGVVSLPTNVDKVDVSYDGAASSGVATFTIATLAAGEEVSIPVTYTVDPVAAEGQTYRNAAEISYFADTDGIRLADVDSYPDNNPDNDAYTDPETPPEADGGESPDFLPDGYTDLHAANPDDEDDADFEFVSLSYSLGNKVWLDQNNDGLVDAGEPPIEGVTVDLYLADRDGQPAARAAVEPQPIATTTTDADGLYLFDNLPRAEYVVVIPASNFASGGALYSMTSSTPTELDANDDVDNNDNGIETDVDVRSSAISLGYGPEPLGEDPNNDPNSDVLSNLTIDFGFLPVNFDLALRKTPSADTSPVLNTGDSVSFDVTIFNQGTVDAVDVAVTDYLPAGLTLDDADWTDNGDGTATYNTPLSIAAGADPQVISISFVVTSPGSIDNYAEISAQTPVDSSGATLTTPGGNPVVDVDSTPDNVNNEPGDGWLIDDEINLTRATGDEDDHDIASIKTVERFDLALRKTLSPGQSAAVEVGDTVPFTIEVFNQGLTWATNIRVIDYIPPGLVFAPNNPGWTPSADGTTATIALVGANGAPISLAPGASTTVTINLVANQVGTYDNYSEISAQTAVDEAGKVLTGTDGSTPLVDIDSTPDTVNNEPGDGWLIDNEINKTREQGDEDDHDIARVAVGVPVYDLALRKTPAEGQPLQVQRGDAAKFSIEVFNQGGLDANEIQIIDYVPPELTLDDPNWTLSADGLTATYNSLLSLDIGASQTISINFKVVAAGQIDNYAEIDSATPRAPDGSIAVDADGKELTDIDSTPDTINGNDVLVDDVIDNTGGDEDDHDIASLFADEFEFDFALRKTIESAPSPLAIGDIVTFKIEVFNQSEVPATDIKIVDYIPPQMSFVDQPGWSTPEAGKTYSTIPGPVDPGESATTTIQLKVAQPGKIDNYAEIDANKPTFDGGKTTATDSAGNPLVDLDSSPDANNNEPGAGWLIDNEINKTREEGDEDDHDIASVEVAVPRFDLALRKTPAKGQSTNVRVGDLVTFQIEVFNQGTVDANNVTLVDYGPAELSLADGDWSGTGSLATYKVPGTLKAGTSITVEITYRVLKTGTVNNYAEISTQTAVGPDGQTIVDTEGKPLVDVDSTPDTKNNEPGDGWLIDDEIDKTREQGDEDDHDIAVLKSIPYKFDLALRKTVAPETSPTVTEGQVVTFNIEVFNQGEVIARDINLIDYIPAQMELADTTWTAGSGNTATKVVPGPINPGASIVVTIKLKVVTTALINNHAEITGARPTDSKGTTLTSNDGKPLADIDSTPDTVLGNDKLIDDEINKTPATGDEDDEDIAVLRVEAPIFDLALRKLLTSSSVVKVDDLATYSIEVFNQGEVEARDIIVVDYLPAGLVLADTAWKAGPNNTASFVIAGPIKPRQSVTLKVTVRVTSDGVESYTNQSEITSARPTRPDGKPVIDSFGRVVTDIDSVYDNNPNNDVLIDNEINLTPETGDEDDEDIAIVMVDKTIPPTGAASRSGVRLAALIAAAGVGLVAIAGRRRRYRVR